MMGVPGDDGIIPRLCHRLFERAACAGAGLGSDRGNAAQHTVEVSFLEIYQERVRDLLAVRDDGQSLRVREHAVTGPYVQGLSRLAVTSYEEVALLMAKGNAQRTTARTNMNDTSSRSHAVFTLHLTARWDDAATKTTGEKCSRVALVDLAGSERQSKTHATGARLKEVQEYIVCMA